MPYRRLWAPLWWVVLAAYSAVIFVQSSHPSQIHVASSVVGFDKLLHAAAYGLWALVWIQAIRSTFPALSIRTVAVTAIVATTLWGISDEWHQSMVPERTADGADAAADAVGAVLATGGWALAARRRRAPPPRARRKTPPEGE